MIYVTGDTHRVFYRVWDFCDEECTAKEDDVLIILGDAGINYCGLPQDYILKKELSCLPITLFCIHGNHEMRPESIEGYEEVERYGGIVYMEPEFPNLLFAKDGEIYTFGDYRCIVIGGAYSVDKGWRLMNGAGWWPDEQPSDEIKERVEKRLEDENWEIDVVLSHTCPEKFVPHEKLLAFIDQSTVDKSTEKWLDTIEDRLSYKEWYCGHYHIDKLVDNFRFMSDSIKELTE